jgi:uncharacterized LabA/DUF88 family protein
LDRCALFVDANYALAEGALAVHGTRNRDSVSWDYAGLLKLLGGLSRDRTGLQLLRCYWYDAAAEGARVAEHETLADIPGLKLRLSKARPSRKEGVESEIRKDLSALARNHAVTDVIIVSAEEDLGPVIAEVQDLGIRAVLLHIATDGNWASSRTLRQECDDVIDIGSGHLRPYVDLISGAEPQLASAGYREIAVGAGQASGPHPAIEAPGVRLYPSPLAAEYEHAGQLATPSRGQDQRAPQSSMAQSSMAQSSMAQAPTAQGVQAGVAEPSASQSLEPQRPAEQAGQEQLAPQQMAQSQLAQPQPSVGLHAQAQSSVGAQAALQHGQGQQAQGQHAQGQQYQQPTGARVDVPAASFGGGYAGQDGHGQPSMRPGPGFELHQAAGDGRSQPGSNQPGSNHLGPLQGGVQQVAAAGLGHNGPGQNGFGHGQNGQAGAPGPTSNGAGGGQQDGGQYGSFGAQVGSGQPGLGQAGPGQAGPGQYGSFGAQGGSQQGGGPQTAGQHRSASEGGAVQGGAGQGGAGQGGGMLPGNGLAPNGMPANGMHAGRGGNVPGGLGPQPTGPGPQPGPQPRGGSLGATPGNSMPGSHGGLPSNGSPASLGGSGQPVGLPANGMPGSGPIGGAVPSAGAPYGGASYGGPGYSGGSQVGNGQGALGPGGPQSAGAPNAGQHQHGGQAPGSGFGAPQPQPGQYGLPQPGQGQQQGLPPFGQPGQGQPGQGQHGPGQSGPGQPGPSQPAPGQPGPGAQRGGPGMPPQNGMTPLDGQRPAAQQRQLPAGNGAPYPQDRSMPYGGPVQPTQFGTTGYGPGSYGGQQPAPPPLTMSVGEAVQSAHAEGFGFGEAVARDAPALWLEAVLARKPRMPSDLEARLLQGSALPIDSLLHDEVRHALRRGFWDALERSRH